MTAIKNQPADSKLITKKDGPSWKPGAEIEEPDAHRRRRRSLQGNKESRKLNFLK